MVASSKISLAAFTLAAAVVTASASLTSQSNFEDLVERMQINPDLIRKPIVPRPNPNQHGPHPRPRPGPLPRPYPQPHPRPPPTGRGRGVGSLAAREFDFEDLVERMQINPALIGKPRPRPELKPVHPRPGRPTGHVHSTIARPGRGLGAIKAREFEDLDARMQINPALIGKPRPRPQPKPINPRPGRPTGYGHGTIARPGRGLGAIKAREFEDLDARMQINPALIGKPRPRPHPKPVHPRPGRPTGHGHETIARPRELVDEIMEELSRRSLDFDELDELE